MVHTQVVEEAEIERLHSKLLQGGLTLPEKYRILYSLRNCANPSALEALLTALKDESALFRHDVAFALGQRQESDAISALIGVLEDEVEDSMVRHEAAEALGAIGAQECLEPLRRYEDSESREVSETCILARQRVEFLSTITRKEEEESKFLSVDPTPPFGSEMPADSLHGILNNENWPLFERYRALFSLRNAGSEHAVESIMQCILSSKSALLKHEIAYVLGQLQRANTTECLKKVLRDNSEHPMVRHEAAEALGAIADESCVEVLREYSSCDEPVVADSCIVALDMIAHEKSGNFEYADVQTAIA